MSVRAFIASAAALLLVLAFSGPSWAASKETAQGKPAGRSQGADNNQNGSDDAQDRPTSPNGLPQELLRLVAEQSDQIGHLSDQVGLLQQDVKALTEKVDALLQDGGHKSPPAPLNVELSYLKVLEIVRDGRREAVHLNYRIRCMRDCPPAFTPWYTTAFTEGFAEDGEVVARGVFTELGSIQFVPEDAVARHQMGSVRATTFKIQPVYWVKDQGPKQMETITTGYTHRIVCTGGSCGPETAISP